MKKCKKKPGWYYCSTWRNNFYYFLGWPWDDFVAYARKVYNYEITDNIIPTGKCLGLTDKSGCYDFLIWTEKKPKNPRTISILAHECLHAANWCLDFRGVNATMQNHESVAYLMMALIREGLNQKERKKKK